MDAAQLWDYIQSLQITLPDNQTKVQLVPSSELPGSLPPSTFSLDGSPVTDAIATEIKTLNFTPQFPNGMGNLSRNNLQIMLTGKNVGNTSYVARALTIHLSQQQGMRTSARELSTMPATWAIEVSAWS